MTIRVRGTLRLRGVCREWDMTIYGYNAYNRMTIYGYGLGVRLGLEEFVVNGLRLDRTAQATGQHCRDGFYELRLRSLS